MIINYPLVIASVAKQSIIQKLDCFTLFTMTKYFPYHTQDMKHPIKLVINKRYFLLLHPLYILFRLVSI